MPLFFKKGDIFKENTCAIVNPVNTQGVVGAGFPYEFKNKFPIGHDQYVNACNLNTLDVGGMLVVYEQNHHLLYCATKAYHNSQAKSVDIEACIICLRGWIDRTECPTIAIPAFAFCNDGTVYAGYFKQLLQKHFLNIDKRMVVFD